MRTWKVGSITCGILLITIGVLWFLQNFIDLPFVEILLNAWPFVCIFIGAEILFLHFRNKEEKLHIHWLAIVLLILIGLASMGFSLGKVFLDQVQFSFNEKTIEINEKVSSDSTNEISIDIPEMDVTVVGGESNLISLTGKIEGNLKSEKVLRERFDKNFTMKRVGEKIFIELNEDSNEFNEIADINGKLYLSVPKNANLKVVSEGGRIDLSDLTGKVTVKSNWGGISVSNVIGTLNVESHGGSIDITNSHLTGNSTVNAEDGQFTWNLLDVQTGTIEASTKYGEIQGNIGWVFKETNIKENEVPDAPDSKKATAKIGDTPGPAIMVTTDNGSIKISK
ncbi:MAG: hypothetical protein K0R18_2618 [Bacillales bacterium]|jgi:hypothetical protein|nr:hypothetical protein [Bacillales bacterium]